MRELGQFLAAPGSLFNTPSAGLFIGLVVLCFTLLHMVLLFVVPLTWGVPVRRILILIPCVALASILLVLLTQWAAVGLRDVLTEDLGMGLRAAGFGSPLQILGRFIFLIVAYIIGWGYSQSLEDVAFDQHILSFTVGTGVVEEVVKGVAGLLFVLVLFLERDDPSMVTLGQWLAGFTAAGL